MVGFTFFPNPVGFAKSLEGKMLNPKFQ